MQTAATNDQSRRAFLLNTLQGLIAMGFCGNAVSGVRGLFNDVDDMRQPKTPLRRFPDFSVSQDGSVVQFEWGYTIFTQIEQAWYPVYIATASDLAELNCMDEEAYIRIGKSGGSNIIIDSKGFRLPGGQYEKFSGSGIKKLITVIEQDINFTNGALDLRMVFLMSVAAHSVKSVGRVAKRVSGAASEAFKKLGKEAMDCKTRAVTTLVETGEKIEKVIDVWSSAEEQMRNCVRTERDKSACESVGKAIGVALEVVLNLSQAEKARRVNSAKIACAKAICAAKTFIDIVIGTITVMVDVVEEVTEEIKECAPAPLRWPSPAKVLSGANRFIRSIAQPKLSFTGTDFSESMKLVRSIVGTNFGLGCLLDGKWEIRQLEMQLNLNNKIVYPYGVKVCISRNCAEQLTLERMASTYTSSGVTLMSGLAALSPEFAALVAGVVAPAAGVTAALAAVPPALISAVTAAAILILVMLLILLYYATAISAQISFHVKETNNLKDGTLCIEHPTMALSLLTNIGTGSWGYIIPPVVTG